jgi:TPR repeat protein
MAAAQAEREKALHEAEEAQRKRATMASVRNIALVAVSIFAVLAGLLALYSVQQRTLAEEQRAVAEEQREQADEMLAGAMRIFRRLQDQMDTNTKKEFFAVFVSAQRQTLEWYLKAVDKGDTRAMSKMGWLYENGFGLRGDYARAREWYEKGAEDGDPISMRNLGALYYNGLGVAQDYAEAHKWYKRAADKGDARAMTKLGELYYKGHGAAQDYAKAREWFEMAAAKGNTDAKSDLETLSITEAAGAGRYAEALQLQEALAARVEAAETKSEGKPGEETAQALHDVVGYALLAREFTKALTASDRAHALLPNDLAIETNRAHSLMFLEHEQDARALYLTYKGKRISEGKLWERAIAEDFAELRKAGLTHPMMADIEKELGVSP